MLRWLVGVVWVSLVARALGSLIPYGEAEGDQVNSRKVEASVSRRPTIFSMLFTHLTLPPPCSQFHTCTLDSHSQSFILALMAPSRSVKRRLVRIYSCDRVVLTMLVSLVADVGSLKRQNAIAVYYVKTSSGNIYYRVDKRADSKLHSELSAKLVAAFDGARDFAATEIVLITWEDMLGVDTSGLNIFQLGLVSNGTESYAILIYSRLDYALSDGKFADLGFFASDGRAEALFNAGTATATEVAK